MRPSRITPAAVLALLFTLAPGCAATAPEWAHFGTDVLGCASPGITATVSTAADDLYLRATGGESADWKSLGTGLAVKYGVPLAICAVEAAFARFSTPGHRGLAPPHVVDAVSWLRTNKAEWTRVTPPGATPAEPAPTTAPTLPAPPAPAVAPAPAVPATPPASR